MAAPLWAGRGFAGKRRRGGGRPSHPTRRSYSCCASRRRCSSCALPGVAEYRCTEPRTLATTRAIHNHQICAELGRSTPLQRPIRAVGAGWHLIVDHRA